MLPNRTRRTGSRCVLTALLTASLMFQSVSCGTLLYPERIGQPRGALDPAVVALNTIGLLLFIVPGAIAFAVDFYNGTIYLPPHEYRGQTPETEFARENGLLVIPVDRADLSPEELEATLERLTGKPVSLRDDNVSVSPVRDLDAVRESVTRPASDELPRN